MDNVIQLASFVAAPSQVDPPVEPEPRTIIIELEHEIADLQVVIAHQAVKLSKPSMPLDRLTRHWRVSVAILGAFMIGWMLEPPSTVLAASEAHTLTVAVPAPVYDGTLPI